MTTSFAPLQFLPPQILEFDSLPSTNDFLKDAASLGTLEEGTVIWAHQQTNGKGQYNNFWLSEPGKNITLSILLKPKTLLASEAFRLSKTMALAVCKTVEYFVNDNPSIKWPNDIFVNSQKIAGILIENSIQGDAVKQSIIGIGINVNQTAFFTDNYPTSLSILSGKSLKIHDIIEVLLENVSLEYLHLQLNNFKKIDGDYFQRLHKVYAEQTFSIHQKNKNCIINDVLPDGSIVLTVDGKKEVYLHGDAQWKL